MTTETSPPVADAGGDSSEKNPPQSKDSVAYETHRKLLDEKKKLQLKLDQIETDRKAAEEAELAKKGEYQRLLDLERKRAADLEAKVKQQDAERKEARKLSAIAKGLGAPVEQKWLSVLSDYLDDVIVNEDTGEVEAMSVTSVVESIKKEWPEMIRKPGAGMPQDAPRGNGGAMIARSEWLKLPVAEMRKWRPNQIME